MPYITAIAGILSLGAIVTLALRNIFSKTYPGEHDPDKYATRAEKMEGASTDGAVEYDYVIVGGGTAGCVLANRLTENPDVSVLVLEAGDVDSKQLFSKIPSTFCKLFKSASDWNFMTEPEKSAGNRSLYWPRGKFLGGCSSINAMCYHRCAPSNYDEWATLGATGWNFSNLLPYFTKAETFNDTNSSYRLSDSSKAAHGTKGPCQTSYTDYFDPSSAAFIQDCTRVGIPFNEDVNVPENTSVGVTRLQTFTKDGVRSSASTAYVMEEVARRKNLTIGLNVHVTRILFEQKGKYIKAVGVEFAITRGGLTYRIRATKEVLLCAGAINSPHLLMLSGIGPAPTLAAHNIPLTHALPGVGANLSDHPAGTFIFRTTHPGIQYVGDPLKSLPPLFNWLLTGKGVLTSNVGEAAAFIRYEPTPEDVERGFEGNSGVDCPDLEIIFAPAGFRNHGLPPSLPDDKYLSMVPILLTPRSKGELGLRSADPWDKPVIKANYLQHWQDRKILLYGCKVAIEIAKLEGGNIRKMNAGREIFFPDFDGKSVDDITVEDIEQKLESMIETVYHPTSTCKMGQPEDETAVVDPRLRVKGVRGLRIIDASVFPKLVAGHTSAPVIAVAERAADLIKEDLEREN